MLRIPKGPPPSALTSWQATPGADWGSLPAADKDAVRAALLNDQGHLCAYCQRRIPARGLGVKVEHWQAQSTGDDSLRWANLLGVCPGDESVETGSPRGERHCDTSRGDAPLFLHPIEGRGPSSRDHLSYSAEGEVTPRDTPARVAVRADITALNLNAARLRRERRVVYDELKRRLEKADWSTKALRDEHRAARIEPGTRALPQCEVVRYHLARWARRRGQTL
jgi:uncharacterized protein (TIGR02646 family)